MKKFLYITLALVVCLIIWLYINKTNPQKPLTTEPVNAIVEPQPPHPETNPAEFASNANSIEAVQPSTNLIESIVPLANALTATNIEQWKAAISGLNKLGGFTLDQHWLMEQPGRKIGLPITLNVAGKTVEYNAVLISVNAQNETGQIMRIEMQTPNMNIDETRELGLQLCDMFGRAPDDFLAWCDKVGNHWLDSPLYSSKNIHTPDNNETFGFQSLHTFNNEKPWMINFVITSP